MEALNRFYKDVLDFAGLKVNQKGLVLNENNEPVIVGEGNMLVIPTRDQLVSLTEDKEVFHPLSEDTLVKMSKPLVEYQKYLNIELNVLFAALVNELIGIACSPSRNREMASNPDRLKILRSIEGKGSDSMTLEKNEKLLTFIVKQLSKNPTGAFLHFTVRRGGEYKGQRQARVGYTSFDLYYQLKEDLKRLRKDSEFPALSGEQIGMITAIYETVFPGIEDREAYNYGYPSGPYPFFTTLLNTAGKLAEALNKVIYTFKGALSDTDDIKPMNMDWKEVFDDKDALNKLRYMVGNLDKDAELEKGPARVDVSQQPTPAPVQETRVQTTYTPTPIQEQRPTGKTTGRERVSIEDWVKQKAAPSALGFQGNVMDATKRHNEGYSAWYAQATANNRGIPPYGLPHPSQIPPGQTAPMYPGSPLGNVGMVAQPVQPQVYQGQMPMQPQVYPGQPQTQPVYGQPVYGQPVYSQPQPTVDAWGRPIQQAAFAQPQMQPVYGQPVYGQQPVQGWGQQPMQQATSWGTPVQQPVAQMGYGQQPAWNQPNGTVIPGAR